MKPETKKIWIDALRSGRYKQGVGYLHKGDTYCCLGVLADCFLEKKEKSWDICYPVYSPNGMLEYNIYKVFPDSVQTENGGITFLPEQEDFENWAGIIQGEVQEILTGLNDEDGKSFDEIANWIEENL